MYQAAIDSELEIYLIDAMSYMNKKQQITEYDPQDGKKRIKWESRKGLKTTEGGFQSPATRLEHEFAHAINQSYHGPEYRDRKKNPNRYYFNEEEKFVIEGAETKTALANGEDIRKNHYGTTYDVYSSDSTIPLNGW